MGRLIDDGLVLDNLSGRLESMKDYDAVEIVEGGGADGN